MKLEEAERSLLVSVVNHGLGVLRVPVLFVLGAWRALNDVSQSFLERTVGQDGTEEE